VWPAVPGGWSWPPLLSACTVHVQGGLGLALHRVVQACGGLSIGEPASQLTRWQPGPCAVVQWRGLSLEVFGGFRHGRFCEHIGGQVSGSIVQSCGLAKAKATVAEGEFQSCLCGGAGTGAQDQLGCSCNRGMDLGCGVLQCLGGSFQRGGAGQISEACNIGAAQ
jgi:hypothetical protein